MIIVGTPIRAVVCLLIVAATILSGTVAAAAASPRGDLINCGDTDAPIPASPYGDGSFIVEPSTADTALPKGWKPGEIDEATDPFRNPDTVSIESVYGTGPQWWTYDTGCTGQFVAGAGTALANIELQISGILPSWSHALLDTVIGDSDLFKALDAPVKATTEAVSAAVWEPWLPVALLLVAGLVLWRARSGRLGGAVTAASTALGVLALTSFLMAYPTESVELVDNGVRTTTGLIAAGFTGDRVIPEGGTSGDPASEAIDAQMDNIVRTTQYRTWTNGVFGDPDSATARTYGPRVFRATHFSWAEYRIHRSDPTGKGKEIVEAKQAAFKQAAEDVKRADPVAYEHFKGAHWGSRITTGLVNLLVVCIPCVFLLLASLIAVMGFVLIRFVVPLAPAAGVIFLFDTTRDIAVGWLKRVVGPLVMGPICLLVALVLLRFTSAILEVEEMWWILKIGLIAVLTVIAWRLARPLGVIPGMERVRSRIAGVLTQALGATHGTRDGLQDISPYAAEQHASTTQAGRLESSPGGVYHPAFDTKAPGLVRVEAPDHFVPYLPLKKLAAEPTVLATGMEVARTGQYAEPIGPIPRRDARKEFPPPPVDRRVREPALGPRTRFDYSGREPRTAYEVDGRGTFFTDDDGEVRHSETDYGGRQYPNPDLNHPEPNMTYVVGGIHVFQTDSFGRPIKAVDPQPAPGPAYRSTSIQSAVGKAGGDGYVGGHLIMNQHAGGRERINLVAQLEEMNQSGSVRFGSIPNNYYAFERFLNNKVMAGKDVYVSLYVEYIDDQSRTPKLITAEYTIDGVTESEDFPNVR